MPQSAPNRQPIRILHLEDNPADARLCEYSLKEAGLEFILDTARTGKEFREKIQKNSYDMLLADYRLPDWNGLDAVRWCRAEGFTTPFILVTGTLGDELAVECMKEGAIDYVLKDRMRRLPIAIHKALDQQAVREQRDRAQADLSQREQEYRSIVQGAPYGIYRVDRAGNILMANPALAAMLGYETEAHVLKLNSARDIFVDPASREQVLSQITSVISFSEHQWRRKDGKQIAVRLAGRRLPALNGKEIFELFVENITEQRLLEQQFLQAQ